MALTMIPSKKLREECFLKMAIQHQTAESCTGGYIAHLITSVPGSRSTLKVL